MSLKKAGKRIQAASEISTATFANCFKKLYYCTYW
jgi:hypothetical protein